MILAILILLIISIALNVVFYVKLSKANTKIKNMIEISPMDEGTAWGKFEKIVQ